MYVKMVSYKLHTVKLLLFKLYNRYRIRCVLCRHSLSHEHGSICIVSKNGPKKIRTVAMHGNVGNLSSGNKNKWKEMHINKLFVHMLVIRSNVHLTSPWAENHNQTNKWHMIFVRIIAMMRNQGVCKCKSTFKVYRLDLSFFSISFFSLLRKFFGNISYWPFRLFSVHRL